MAEEARSDVPSCNGIMPGLGSRALLSWQNSNTQQMRVKRRGPALREQAQAVLAKPNLRHGFCGRSLARVRLIQPGSLGPARQ